MSFLDEFTDDMREVTVSKKTSIINSQWEREPTTTQEFTIQCLLFPIGVIQADRYHSIKQIEYHKSTHLAWYSLAHTFPIGTTLTDKQWVAYTVQHTEPVYDFWGEIDHMTAFLTTIQ